MTDKVSIAPEDVERLAVKCDRLSVVADDADKPVVKKFCADTAATLRALSAEVERLKNVNRTAANFITLTARRLDGWAQESKTGGWSTHQVKANTNAADHCRKYADAIRAALGE